MTQSKKPRKQKASPSEMLGIAMAQKKAFDEKQAKKQAKQLQETVKATIKADKAPAPAPAKKKVVVSGKTGRKKTVTSKSGKKKPVKRSAKQQEIFDAIQLDKQVNKAKYAKEVKELNAENEAHKKQLEADRKQRIKNNPPKYYTKDEGIEYYTTEAQCYSLLEDARKVDGVLHCHYCKHETVWRNKARQNFKCAKCLRQFSVTTDTFLHKSKIDIRLVFKIIMNEIRSTTGLTIADVLELSRYTISYPTAVSLLHKIRHSAFTQKLFTIDEDSKVQADTTSISGSDRNRHDHKKKGKKKLYAEQHHFLTKWQERGDAIVTSVRGLGKVQMEKGMRDVPNSCEITTDGHSGFLFLNEKHKVHNVVNHSMGENARGRISTNGAESVHATIKVALAAHFNTIKGSNLQQFINSVIFTRNTKHKLTFEEQVNLSIKGIVTTAKPVKAKVVSMVVKKLNTIPQYNRQLIAKAS